MNATKKTIKGFVISDMGGQGPVWTGSEWSEDFDFARVYETYEATKPVFERLRAERHHKGGPLLTTAEAIKAERERLGLSQADAARHLGIKPQSYGQLEGSKGEPNPSAGMITRLARIGFSVRRMFPAWYRDRKI